MYNMYNPPPGLHAPPSPWLWWPPYEEDSHTYWAMLHEGMVLDSAAESAEHRCVQAVKTVWAMEAALNEGVLKLLGDILELLPTSGDGAVTTSIKAENTIILVVSKLPHGEARECMTAAERNIRDAIAARLQKGLPIWSRQMYLERVHEAYGDAQQDHKICQSYSKFVAPLLPGSFVSNLSLIHI